MIEKAGIEKVGIGQDGMAVLTPGAQPLTAEALRELRQAMARLERGPGLVPWLAGAAGTALGGVGRLVAGRLGALALPDALRTAGMEGLGRLAQAALVRAFEVAVVGVRSGTGGERRIEDGRIQTGRTETGRTETGRIQTGRIQTGRSGGARTRLLVAASGAAGGAAGLAGFAPDAAVTTLAIMRRIAVIAQEEGEDLRELDARRACLEVFALRAGVPGEAEEAGSGYFSTRLLLQGGPLMRLLAEVGARYGVQLGQKLAAQAIPIAGAILGAAINSGFLAEYEGLARAHFTVRRLERTHGAAAVRAAATVPAGVTKS